MFRIVSSTSSAHRLDAAYAFIAAHPPAAAITIVGASRGAADDFVRAAARRSGATFGLSRFSLTELAAHAALVRQSGLRRLPGTHAGSEAIAARAVFDAVLAGELEYFAPVASTPGFSKALARTLHELRLAGVDAARLDGRVASNAGSTKRDTAVDAANADLGCLLARVEEQLARSGVDDRAALYRAAADACRSGATDWPPSTVVLLDVPIDSRAEREFVAALIERSSGVLATVPDGDQFARSALLELGGELETIEDTPAASSPGADGSDLASLRRFIFTSATPPGRDRAGDVRLFSAPGEGREAVEIVRRVLDEAARGVPFDDMAICLRAPQQYLGLLEHACARGGVPAYFDRGTRRPDPSGRAFVALLSCAVDGLSAKRFDEYLSLGQVPQVDAAAAGRAGTRTEAPLASIRPADEVFHSAVEAAQTDDAAGPEETSDPPEGERPDSSDEAVIAGTLRSPWKWEELIVESAVVGGRTREDGAARWERRLDGLAADFRYRLSELRRDEPESPRIARYERELRNLQHLRLFALPLIRELAGWPERATWGDWLDRFDALATQALGRPARVRQTLADLRPMSAVGPVALEEARDVLHDRLVMLDWEPPARRYGRVFVGTPHQARGRRFRIVFVPGLAERVVPQRPREDPLLLDERRRVLDGALVRQETRGAAERLLLKIAIGAATERLYLSYPRLDVAETRARVPSFYALDVMRAITGQVPDYRVLAADAADEGGASLAWPAPKDPDRAIDDLEHDLAVLKPLLDARPGTGRGSTASLKGRAHYMLDLNPALRRSVISRWSRGRSGWSPSDGLIRVSESTRGALAAHRLAAREYSLSALQRYATCPYQFLLATIYRLEPWDDPTPIVRMDPLTRGSLFHKVQAEFLRAMKASDRLPVPSDRVDEAVRTLDSIVDREAAGYAERLAPAIDRVWRDEIDELRRDLSIWVRKLADGSRWVPRYFEFSFGLADDGRDPDSLPQAIALEQGYRLRGSVDLIEHDPALDVLRVTDHKTGKNRSNPDLIVGGGSVLQPVLYSVAIERGLGQKVVGGRLFYSTTAGGFVEHTIPINDYTRGQGVQVLEIIDRAVETGFLAAAPADRACTWCDFRSACGPREEERTARKSADKLADLSNLRSMR
jgi:ATP-dependent helicase/nuclease subunit B